MTQAATGDSGPRPGGECAVGLEQGQQLQGRRDVRPRSPGEGVGKKAEILCSHPDSR